MNPYQVGPGIRFNDYVFSEPRRLVETALPKCGGILVILARDPNWAPRPFQPLCFREFGNNAPESQLIRWARPELYISFLAMPFTTAAQRCEIRNQLVWSYNPVLQTNGFPPVQSELAHKVDELERKNEEQTTQIRLLLASINRMFEPQAEPRRRPIGFLPQPAAMAGHAI